MSAYPQTRSLREIDQELGLPKGSAFRAFKRLETDLEEGADYLLLRAGEDHEAIAALRNDGRIYVTSRNVLLLSIALSERIKAALQTRQ